MGDFHVRDLEMTPLRSPEIKGHYRFRILAIKFLLVSLRNSMGLSLNVTALKTKNHVVTDCNRLQTDRHARSDERRGRGGALTCEHRDLFVT